MAMLVYRGYAEQDASRRYIPGPAMGLTPTGLMWTAELRHRARPHLERLTERLGETSNIVVLSGDSVRFLLSVQHSASSEPSDPTVRIGDRRGVVLPADKTSSGKALLAQMSRERVSMIFRNSARREDTTWLERLLNELAIIRTRGFATNFEATEHDVSTVGVAIHDGNNAPVSGLSVSVPHERFSTAVDAGLVEHLHHTKAELEKSLSNFTVHE